MATIKETKPKLLNTLDALVSALQADDETPDVECQAVMIAREVLAASGVTQIARAVNEVAKKHGDMPMVSRKMGEKMGER